MKSWLLIEFLSILSRRLNFLAGELPSNPQFLKGGVTMCANKKSRNICNQKPSKFRQLDPCLRRAFFSSREPVQ